MEIMNRHEEETFFLNNFNMDKIFNSIERTDYFFLYYIKCCTDETAGAGKVYLTSLAEAMRISIPVLSKAMENLQDKGYVVWKTDRDEGRTYVELTSKAIELMGDERKRMEKCYKMIREEISGEELEQVLRTMKRINGILASVSGNPEDTV